ncbi:hypothetical protein BKA65DRAFT_471249 [Rhexocercosporidium sp. MPI-PUGE-AT-0058]|nr:hypothetical protein BKA65DRAFT_471249 [Rhexocercosporidium sp. MPI-PUGE-AT-0058]
MISRPDIRASAPIKRKVCINTVAIPNKAAKIISIPPPKSHTKRPNGILRGSNQNPTIKFPTFGYIDCRPRPRSRKRISWDPKIVAKWRTQKQIKNYITTFVDIEEHWWDDPDQLKACESFLTTSDGRLLDALMGLTPVDVQKMVMQIPVKVKDMVLSISRKLAESEEIVEGELMAEGIEDTDIETEDDEEDDTVEEEKMNQNFADEKIARQNVLLEYVESRLEDFIFCRYQGTLRQPSVCPKAALRSQSITIVDQATKDHGPTSYIVSLVPCRNRPLLSPIRFSQVQMAMKLYRQDKQYKHWIKSLKDIAGYFGNPANHFMSSECWITDDRLLVRTQSWVYAHNLEPESKAYVQAYLNGDHLLIYDRSPMTSWACRHLNASPDKHMFDFDNPEESAKVHRCDKCAMEYRIDIAKSIPVSWTLVSPHSIVGDAFCAVVTVYRDFGRCLTPYDPRWMSHFLEYEYSGFTGAFPAENQMVRNPAEEECANDWEVGGIMRAFEDADETDPIELSLHESVLKLLLSTEEERWEEAEEERMVELERQRREQEELERKAKEEEEKEKSWGKRLKEKYQAIKKEKEAP